MPKITVIIPGCTSELYLERCIQSLQHQTFQDFEILLVIDESQKSVKTVCDTFAINPQFEIVIILIDYEKEIVHLIYLSCFDIVIIALF